MDNARCKALSDDEMQRMAALALAHPHNWKGIVDLMSSEEAAAARAATAEVREAKAVGDASIR